MNGGCYNFNVDEREFRNFLIEDCQLDPETSVVVGFSGGPDSTCLLHRLWRMSFPVIAVHLDHGLRPGSCREAEFVGQLCVQWGIQLVAQSADVSAYSAAHKISIEEAAREVRYRFLFDTARQSGAQAVLVAHHADDQVETVLMHFLRGSGTSGLAGMRLRLLPNPWSASIPLVRPLLFAWRKEIEEYCRQHELTPLQDESNTDTTYFRNRIRRELIPDLQTYNPGLKERMLRTAAVTAEDEACLQSLTEQAWRECLVERSTDFILLNQAGMLTLPPALRNRLVRKAMGELNATLRDIDYQVIQRAAHFIGNPGRTNRVNLMAGLEALICFHDQVMFARKEARFDPLWPQLTQQEIEFSIPGVFPMGTGWELTSEQSSNLEVQGDEWSCLLDADALKGPLRLRRFIPGDRFEPLGMDGKVVKLGDFWTEAGLPVRARKNWPLLADDQRILWVPGFRLSHAARIREGTTHAIRFTVEKK